MSAVTTLAGKDLLLLWRDKQALFWMLAFPLVFAVFFGSIFGPSGGDGGSRGIALAVVEESVDSKADEAFVAVLAESDALRIVRMPRAAADDAVRRGRIAAWLDIVSVPENAFDTFRGDRVRVVVGMDPSRRAEQGMLQGLLTAASFRGIQEVFSDVEAGREEARRMRALVAEDDDIPLGQRLALTSFFVAMEQMFEAVGEDGESATEPAEGAADQAGGEDASAQQASGGSSSVEPDIEVVAVARQRTGPPNAFSISFPQSMLWALLGATAGFAITIVRERTSGTMVRLLTAPITRRSLLLGKALACFATLCGALSLLTLVGWLGFGVEVASPSLFVLAVVSVAICFTGLGMLFSAIGKSEQAVAGMAWGVLILFAMLGGGMVPQIAMPSWMLTAGTISPAKWAIEAFEGAIWRGYSLSEMALPCAIPLAVGIVAFAIGARLLDRASR
jgi:ABC-2 type transport system permease protein